MNRASAIATAALVAVVGACDALSAAIAPPTVPRPCDEVFNAVRCLAIRDSAASKLDTTREDIVGVVIVPESTPEVRDGQTIIRTTSGGRSVEVLVTLADGSTGTATIHCGTISDDPGCFDDPRLEARAATLGGGGSRDVPEGSSPVPSAAPEAVAAAMPLLMERLDIAIDHVGRHDVRLGEARLANGLLSEATFDFVEDWPPGITILDRSVTMEIRSAVDGELIWNIYEHGWHDGVEPVEVFLVFDVFRFDPGATLSVRNVVVR